MDYKQVIITRKDLKLGVGKLAAQVAHASLSATRKSNKQELEPWENQGSKKVVLQVNTLEEMQKLFQKAKQAGIPCALIKDAGLTEIEPGTITALAIGPAKESDIDKLTGDLPLLE